VRDCGDDSKVYSPSFVVRMCEDLKWLMSWLG
jgi:hypothetical protein